MTTAASELDPAPPARRFYYGWVMVLVAAVAMVATLPGRTHGLGMITERLMEDESLGLSRTAYGFINFWATLLGAAFCLGVGRLIDRWGVRPVLTCVLALLGGTVVAMTFSSGMVVFFAAITLLRGFGQSALSVVSLSIVGKWFRQRLSWAMALYSTLLSIGFIAAAMIAREYAQIDWRFMWGGLGLIVLALVPLAWLLARNSPAACGVGLDGGEATAGNTLSEFAAARQYTTGEALRTPAFWLFAFATSLFGLTSAGITLFNESILIERGLTTDIYYQSMAMAIGIGLAGNFLAGWLASWWSLTRLVAIALTVLALSLAWLTQINSFQDVVVYVLLSAPAGSTITVVFFTVWGKLYGQAHLGRIQGAAQMLTVIASAIGPALFGFSKDQWAGYGPVLWGLASVTLVLAGVAWLTPLPATTEASARNNLADPASRPENGETAERAEMFASATRQADSSLSAHNATTPGTSASDAVPPSTHQA